MSDLEDGCAGVRKYFPENDAYTGPGPHPIGVFITSDSDALDLASMGADVPPQWDDTRLDPRQVQVIACLARRRPVPGRLQVHFGHAQALLGSTEPSCPSLTLTKSGADSIHTEPDFAAYRAALGKYVDN